MNSSVGLFAFFLAFLSANHTAPDSQSRQVDVQSFVASGENLGNQTIPGHRAKRGVGNDKCDGCYRGQCWSYCDNGIRVDYPWCYGSPTRSQDFNYQKCNSAADCTGNQCWYCAGSCTI